ncbi:MAG: DUF898 domain-containing protein [Gammaproteobacteria bacterium]|nr:DUF898 domain-containing protein [Gammaproteobacteria bacterium]
MTTQEVKTPSYRTSTVEFSGKGGEFFGIWIVNILLTIVTLGIYSAWAKVRTQQYFFGHTKVDGHAFRYLATPIQILKGRLLAFAVIAVFSLLTQLIPVFALVFALAAIFVMPWLLVQGIKFNLRMTAYRNVRFGFHGTYGGAFLNFIVFPIIAVFTFYLLMPYVLKRMDKFVYENVSFGGRKMQVNTIGGTYYEAVFKAFFATLGAFIVFAIVLAIFAGITGLAIPSGDVSALGGVMAIVFGAVYILGYVLVIALSQAIYRATIRNHVFASSELEGVAKFKSSVDVFDYCILLASNYLMIAFSLGLTYPVAKVRHAAYLASLTEVSVNSEIDNLTDPLKQESSTFLEEAADLYDIDFSLT